MSVEAAGRQHAATNHHIDEDDEDEAVEEEVVRPVHVVHPGQRDDDEEDEEQDEDEEEEEDEDEGGVNHVTNGTSGLQIKRDPNVDVTPTSNVEVCYTSVKRPGGAHASFTSESTEGQSTSPLAGDEDHNGVNNLFTWHRDGAVKIRREQEGPACDPPVTVIDVFKTTCKRAPEKVALATKVDGRWTGYTYSWYWDQVSSVARAFIKLGLQPTHGVAIIGFNSPEWFISSYAAIMAGGLSCGIYTTNSAEACQKVIQNCLCDIVVVENNQQLQKILSVIDQLPSVKAIVQYTGEPPENIQGVITWGALLEMGEENAAGLKISGELEQRVNSLKPNKCCIVLQTSGTTGDHKGCMLSHDNLIWSAKAVLRHIKPKDDKEVIVSYLPLSHAAALLFDSVIAMIIGASVYFAQPDALRGTLFDTVKEARPTRFFGVPRVWEKLQESIEQALMKVDDNKAKMINWAREKSVKSHMAYQRGEPKFAGFKVGHKLVHTKLHKQIGFDRCQSFYSGAAPIRQETIMFFMSINIPLLQVYGLTECSGPHALGSQRNNQISSVGQEMPGVKTVFMEADAPGHYEICIGGRNVFMGYLNNEKETRAIIDEKGWLHSGDLGYKDKNGLLYITGRIKELIITAGGENIPPLAIEQRVQVELPCISHCMLIGEMRKFLCMLLTFKTTTNPETGLPGDTLADAALRWCQSVGSKATTLSQILDTSDVNVLKAVQLAIDRVNEKATSHAQRIQKWSILPQDFTIAGGELGPTAKMRRKYIERSYAETIEAFYATAGGPSHETNNNLKV